MSGEWKQEYEFHADKEHDAMKSASLPELIRRVERRQFGEYYGVWDGLAARKDLPAVGWLMFDFLKSNEEYLQRYHCARCLLVLMGITTYEAADLTVAHRNPAVALAEIEQELTRRVGARLPNDNSSGRS